VRHLCELRAQARLALQRARQVLAVHRCDDSAAWQDLRMPALPLQKGNMRNRSPAFQAAVMVALVVIVGFIVLIWWLLEP
jgi:uncharacterized membrane protein YccC